MVTAVVIFCRAMQEVSQSVTFLILRGIAGDEILFAFAHMHTLAQIIREILTEYISKLLSLGAITFFSFFSLKNTNMP